MQNGAASPLILASASPRRAELLRAAGIAFRVEASNLEEARESGETPRAYAERLARDKARVVAQRFPGQPVLAADTIVVLRNGVDDAVLEKPADAADAARMLRHLSGRAHEVTTAVCLLAQGEEQVRSETTRVLFRRIETEEILAYIATGEPMDKAGAYAIQGGAARWVDKIEGDYENVVGLPVALVRRMLQAAELL
ncbi:MAG: septum formation inhibitor Maf [Candidatus Koribacter versatilis]|uniref:dTTP/UTP pyrophosphatase n=1 Tax=Candidatus Korobacter versatilis TaxID=658062 RepID=A0A932AB42_9BACT|nr:septum formation inhibitor Maf [Candidatus Koribacter versatilis]